MIEQIRDLLRFYSQRYHVLIDLMLEAHQIGAWDRNGLVVAMPMCGSTELILGDVRCHFDPDFGLKLGGDLLVQNGQSVGRLGSQWIALHLCPANAAAVGYVRKLFDEQLPHLVVSIDMRCVISWSRVSRPACMTASASYNLPYAKTVTNSSACPCR